MAALPLLVSGITPSLFPLCPEAGRSTLYRGGNLFPGAPAHTLLFSLAWFGSHAHDPAALFPGMVGQGIHRGGEGTAVRRTPDGATSQPALVIRGLVSMPFSERKGLNTRYCFSCAVSCKVLLRFACVSDWDSVFLPHGLCGFTIVCVLHTLFMIVVSPVDHSHPSQSIPIWKVGLPSTEDELGMWGSFCFSVLLLFFSSFWVSFHHKLLGHLPCLRFSLLSFLLSSSSLLTYLHGLTASFITAIFLSRLFFRWVCA